MLKLVRPLALFIMVAAMASSYHTQLALFLVWRVDSFTAVIAPFAVDALAVICSIAIGTTGARGKGLAAVVLVVTLGGSMTANFIAGATLGSKIVHAAMVLIYLLAELVSSRVGEGEVKAAAVGAATGAQSEMPAIQEAVTEVTADEAASPDLPEAPQSPAAVSAQRQPYGPRKGDAYSERHDRRIRNGK